MRAIDIHAHWYPQEWLQLFEKDGAKESARLERTAGGYRLKTETLVNTFDERFVDLASRIEKMDEKRIDVHALSLTTPMVNWASPALGLALAQAYNDAASAAHGRHPERFVGLAILPMQDAQLALRELERAAKLPGMRGMYLATNVNGVDLDEKRFWDVYARAQAHETAAERVPQALPLRLDRPRRPHQPESHPAGGRRPRDARQRLLLRHGPRRSAGRGPAPAAQREGKGPDRRRQRGAATSPVSAASSRAASRHRPRPARRAPRGRSIPASAA